MIHLLHAPIDRRAFAQWAASRGASAQGAVDDGAALHILLSALFGKGALQPFRLFTPATGAWALYAYASQSLEGLLDLATAVAPPEMLAVLPLDRIRGRPMPTHFAPGVRLGFDLRARPVRRGAREQDAFLAEALEGHAETPNGMAGAGRSREAVYAAWMAGRLGTCAGLETCRLVAFQRQRALRGGRAVEGPDATLQGTLTVRDSEGFLALLAQGIGRHRAYGYGMLMLRPPDRAALGR